MSQLGRARMLQMAQKKQRHKKAQQRGVKARMKKLEEEEQLEMKEREAKEERVKDKIRQILDPEKYNDDDLNKQIKEMNGLDKMLQYFEEYHNGQNTAQLKKNTNEPIKLEYDPEDFKQMCGLLIWKQKEKHSYFYTLDFDQMEQKYGVDQTKQLLKTYISNELCAFHLNLKDMTDIVNDYLECEVHSLECLNDIESFADDSIDMNPIEDII
jgi:hypothetical protein